MQCSSNFMLHCFLTYSVSLSHSFSLFLSVSFALFHSIDHPLAPHLSPSLVRACPPSLCLDNSLCDTSPSLSLSEGIWRRVFIHSVCSDEPHRIYPLHSQTPWPVILFFLFSCTCVSCEYMLTCACVDTYMYICVRICMCVLCLCVLCVRVPACLGVYLHVWLCVCASVCMCVSVSVVSFVSVPVFVCLSVYIICEI